MLVDARPASACSLATNETHQVDAAHANDTTAPGVVTVTADAQRYFDNSEDGCGGGKVASCGSYGLVTLAVGGTDDATPADQLGYEVTLVDGTPPRDFNVPSMPVRPFAGSGGTGDLYLYYSVTEAKGFRVTLQVRAVDLNGNLGPPTLVTVEETDTQAAAPSSGGCSTVPVPPPVGIALGALALALRRRRRR